MHTRLQQGAGHDALGEKLLKYSRDNLILEYQNKKFKLVLTGKLQLEFDQGKSNTH